MGWLLLINVCYFLILIFFFFWFFYIKWDVIFGTLFPLRYDVAVRQVELEGKWTHEAKKKKTQNTKIHKNVSFSFVRNAHFGPEMNKKKKKKKKKKNTRIGGNKHSTRR